MTDTSDAVWPTEAEKLPAFLSPAGQAAERDHQARDFRLRYVLGQTLSILRRRLLPFLLLFGVVSLLLNVPVAFTRHDSAVVDIAVACGIAMVLYVVAYAFAAAVVVDVVMDSMRGGSVDMTKTLRVASHRFFSALGVTAAVFILLIIGFVLIVVPGLFVITLFFVAIPACVVEGLGPMASLRRSRQLTKGHRWRILALGLANLIIGNVVQMELDRLTEPVGGFVLTFGAQAGWDAIYCAFTAVLVAVTYRDLRVVNEGVDTDQIATVFD